MSDKIELLPCAFCGAEGATTMRNFSSVGRMDHHYLFCHGCGSCGPSGQNDEEAAKAWNMRPSAAKQLAVAPMASEQAEFEQWRSVQIASLERSGYPEAAKAFYNLGSVHWAGWQARAMLAAAPSAPASAPQDECICHTGNASLLHPCPAHPVDVEHVDQQGARAPVAQKPVGWVPMSAEWPPIGVEVLVACVGKEYPDIHTNQLDKGSDLGSQYDPELYYWQGGDDFSEVTHWAPLPVMPGDTAPSAAEQPDTARSLLTDDDMRRLRRFQEICEDHGAGGHDLPKESVRRLELAGALRSCGFGRHETTAFGDYLLGKEGEA